MNVDRVKWLIVLCFLSATCALARGAVQVVQLDQAITPVSGAWDFENGALSERSDAADRDGRPFFATFANAQADNFRISAQFALHDDSGSVHVAPAWIDSSNYVAVVWVDRNELRIVQVRNGSETILARTRFDHSYAPTFRVGAAISKTGIRAFIDDRQVLECGAYFASSNLAAVGGRHRVVTFHQVVVEPIEPWQTDADVLCPLEIVPRAARRAFLRKEIGGEIKLTLRNLSNEPLERVRVVSRVDTISSEQEVPEIPAGGSVDVGCPIPAERLRPDAYHLIVRAQAGERPSAEVSIPVHIARRQNPQRLRVFLWDSVPIQGMRKLADMGFTSTFMVSLPFERMWSDPQAALDESDVSAMMSVLDEALLLGMDGGISFGPGLFTATHVPELRRVARDGTPQTDELNTCNFLAEPRQFANRTAEYFMKTFGGHPAFKLALLNTEMRDGAQPCFHPEDLAAYRQASGREIPPEIVNKYGVSHRTIADFAADRVVSDDHPVLEYYRWFWKQGDSWVTLNDQIHETIRRVNNRDDFITWFDPAVRAAPAYGGGGNLDMIGQWTYTYPDPVRIGMNADELINMARPRDQKVFQMVQAIWYRSETAPKDASLASSSRNPWDDHDPDADYITPSPAQLTEGIWTAISRPIDMIGYHGVGSLLPGNGSSYKYTHPESSSALERIHRRVVTPLGPTLNQIDDRPAEVAFLQSFTTQSFGGPATFGWISGGIGDMWMASQYAGLQSDIIFEETISERGLGQYKVLILPACEVLPRSVFDAIVAFQKSGGIVIGDGLLVPGITPDLRIETIPSGSPLEERETWMRQTAMTMRESLESRYRPFATSEDTNVVLHVRQRDDVQYVFAINDHKAFGDYVGQHGRVKENGLPAETKITLQRAGVKVIDLLEMAEVPTEAGEGSTQFTARLSPGGGAIYVIADARPATLKIDAPSTARRGDTIAFDVSVLDESQNPVPAVVPLDVQIVDPALRPAEPSGAHAAVRGSARIAFELAENERIGTWTVAITERLTGLKQTLYFEVN